MVCLNNTWILGPPISLQLLACLHLYPKTGSYDTEVKDNSRPTLRFESVSVELVSSTYAPHWAKTIYHKMKILVLVKMTKTWL